jgi:hypothetical protein
MQTDECLQAVSLGGRAIARLGPRMQVLGFCAVKGLSPNGRIIAVRDTGLAAMKIGCGLPH